ncbi:MAG TPA: hypothetical protein VNK04_25675 [Gemmataceae bacterium]|nr:hypothetical protein [Gemmataceae bacterium]
MVSPRSRPSFTLVEMVLVLALIVIIAAITIPSLDAMYADYKVMAAVDTVRARWAEARSRAVDEGRPYRFAVVRGKGNFRIAPDSAEHWSGGGSAESSAAGLVIEDALPRGIRFSFGEGGEEFSSNTVLAPAELSSASWTDVVTFLPDGTALALDGNDREEVRITFEARNAAPVLLTLRTLTGTVTARRLYEETWR